MQVIPPGPCINAASTCLSGNGISEEYVYEGNLALPAVSDDWTLHYFDCCPGFSSGLVLRNTYARCTIDNLNVPVNHSPEFNGPFNHLYPVGNGHYLHLSGIDPDGDSLVYTLEPVDVYFTCANGVETGIYNPPYSPSNPFVSSIPITLDSSTGILHFNPTFIMVSDIAIGTKEIRNGSVVGFTKRQFQMYFISNSNTYLPQFNSSILASANGFIPAQCGDQQVMLSFDHLYNCATAVPSDFLVKSPDGVQQHPQSVQPIGCVNGFSDSLLLILNSPLLTGKTEIIVVTGVDGNTLLSECGLEMPEKADTIPVVVAPAPVTWTPAIDTLSCFSSSITITLNGLLWCQTLDTAGTDLILRDAVGMSFPVQHAELNCNGSSLSNELQLQFTVPASAKWPLILFADSSTAIDGNSVATTCYQFLSSSDSLAVFYPEQSFQLPADTSICSSQTFPFLSANVIGNVQYQWSLNNAIIPGAISSGFQPVQEGEYVALAAGPFCAVTDTIMLSTFPDLFLPLQDTILCPDNIPVYIDAGSQQGAIYQWLVNNAVIPGAQQSGYWASQAGVYTVMISDTFGCSYNDSMLLTNYSTPVFSFDPVTICDGQSIVVGAGFSADSYLWSTGEIDSSIVIDSGGVYILTVSQNTCSFTDSISITQLSYPAAPVVSCTLSGSGYQELYTWSQVPGAISYLVSEDNGVSWIPPNMPVSLESHGVNSSVSGFMVRAIGAVPCDSGAIAVSSPCALFVSSLLTPNGDHVNDLFIVQNNGEYPDCKVTIYNLQGNQVFFEPKYDNHTRVFTGENLPTGYYIYQVEPGNGLLPLRGQLLLFH